jgi:hypothetical protein
MNKVGEIQKICVCDKCGRVMERFNILPEATPLYEYKCPKCYSVGAIACEIIDRKVDIIKWDKQQ